MVITSIETVAVIGLGEMGTPKAYHLLNAGFNVRVYDINEEAMNPLVRAGAKRCRSPAEATKEADASLIVVLTEDQVRNVITGTDTDEGIISTAPSGHMVIVGSTISPITCHELAEIIEVENLQFVDAPTASGGDAAERGELLVFVGADEPNVAKARDILETFAKPEDIIHLGPIGSGAVGKAINNMILFTTVVANYEGFRLAKEFDIDIKTLREALIKGSAENWSLRNWEQQHMKTASKDLAIALRMIENKSMSLPMTELTHNQIEQLYIDDLDTVR